MNYKAVKRFEKEECVPKKNVHECFRQLLNK